jgi:hypothetical protein
LSRAFHRLVRRPDDEARRPIVGRGGKEIIVVHFTPEESGARPGETVVFCSWILVLAVGLAYMIAIPLIGR